MAFFLVKNLVFIHSMQSMNSSLDKLVNDLADKDFKYLTEEFGSRNLEILKQKVAILINTSIAQKDLPAKNISLVQPKKEKLIMMVKYQMFT